MPFRSSATALGIAKETTMGTAVIPTFWVPNTKLDGMEGKIDYIKDQSIRANDSMTQGIYQGTIHSEPGFDSPAYPELLPYLFRALIGTDTPVAGVATTTAAVAVAGATTLSATATIAAGKVIAIDTGTLLEYNTVVSVSGAGPFVLTLTTPLKYGHASGVALASLTTHAFAQSATMAQAPTWTLTDWDQVQPRWVPGAMMSELQVKVDPKAMVTTSTKWIGYPSANATTPGTYTGGVSEANLGWAASCKIAGASIDRLITCDLTIKRAVEPIFTANGVQSPRQVFNGPIEVSGKAKVVYESATADLADYLTNNQSSFELNLAYGPVTSQIHMSKVGRVMAAKGRGSKWLELDVDLEGVYNSTDSGSLTAFANTGQTAAY